MKRIFVFIILVSAVALTGGVAAQENSTATEPETPEAGSEFDNPTTQPIDSETEIVGWGYDSGTFRIGIEAESPTVLTLTEAVQFSKGAGQMSIVKQAVPSGTSTVTIEVKQRAGKAAVVITTAQSISEGRGTFVSTGQTQQDRPPVSYGTAGLLAALASLGTGWYAFRRGREKLEESDEPEVSRIA